MRFVALMIGLMVMLFNSSQSIAQGLIYSTYEDYQQKRGTEFDEYSGMFWGATSVIALKFKSNGATIKIRPAKTWGFEYKGQLFRICAKDGIPVMLLSTGKICYYENGFPYIDLLKDGNTEGKFYVGTYCYVSASLASEVMQIPIHNFIRSKKIKELIVANPIFAPLFTCLDTKSYISDSEGRECVYNFQKGFAKPGTITTIGLKNMGATSNP